MFKNQRGSIGVGSIVGVALVMAMAIFGTSMMVKVYRDGGDSQRFSGSSCQVVCDGNSVKVRG